LSCKVPTTDALIDLDAPTVPAYEWKRYHSFVFLCEHCLEWHQHAAVEGHRNAHCSNPASPYLANGYNLVRVGQIMSITQFCRHVRIGRPAVNRMIAAGDIIAIRYKKRCYIPCRDAEFARLLGR